MDMGKNFYAFTRLPLAGEAAERPAAPEPFKTYPGARTIALPAVPDTGPGFFAVATARRSVRRFSGAPLTVDELSLLLRSSCGVTGTIRDRAVRAQPSAGALYPMEVYVLVNRVTGIPAGLYHYAVAGHKLEAVREEELGKELSTACLGQEMPRTAAVNVIMSAVFDRITAKYGARGHRYLYMEAGHISQNLYLAATALGLGSVAVGAFRDDAVNALLGLAPDREAAVYIQCIGRKE